MEDREDYGQQAQDEEDYAMAQKMEEEKYQQINEEEGEEEVDAKVSESNNGIMNIGAAKLTTKQQQSNQNRRRSILEQTHDLRVLLNKIFAMRGGWKIKNLAMDFSDGFLFQELFNILYDENINCCLEGVPDGPNSKLPYETKVLNWNKINAGICFNYFQQQFYFVQGTMLTLAKGKSGELTAQAIRELLIAMQGTHHNAFDDETDVRDIADLLRINIG